MDNLGSAVVIVPRLLVCRCVLYYGDVYIHTLVYGLEISEYGWLMRYLKGFNCIFVSRTRQWKEWIVPKKLVRMF